MHFLTRKWEALSDACAVCFLLLEADRVDDSVIVAGGNEVSRNLIALPIGLVVGQILALHP